MAEKTRSDLYLSLVPAINSGRVSLLRSDRLEAQLVGLERGTSRAGRDVVDHPLGGHDDLANAAAGALVLAVSAAPRGGAMVGAHDYGGGRVIWAGQDADRPRAWHRGPGIREALIDRHFARDPATREPIYDPVIGAMHAARQSAEKAHRVAAAVHANDGMTVSARHRRVRDETWKIVEGALGAMDRARQAAGREHQAIAERTAAPPRPADAASAMLASEIRSRLSTMTPRDRKAAIAAALADGDDAVLGAVLNAPPMLSGLGSAAEHGVVREQWRRTRHAADLDRMERIGRALEDMERAGTLVVALPTRLSDIKIVSAAEAAEAG